MDLKVSFRAFGEAFTFLAQTTTGGIGSVSKALRKFSAQDTSPAYPLVVAPFMKAAGRRACEEAGVGWVDLSGNAAIRVPHLCLLVQGKENEYRPQGRPSSAFAPKSSRIARRLLLQREPRNFQQRELAEACDVTPTLVSRVLKRLCEDGGVRRTPENTYELADPDLLLASWRESYRFDKHRIVRGHILPRQLEDLPGVSKAEAEELRKRFRHPDGRMPAAEAVTHLLAKCFHAAEIPYAVTGLAAAWAYQRFAAYRTTTVYLPREHPRDPSFSAEVSEVLGSIGWREGERGANVWLVVPDDPYVVDLGEGAKPPPSDPLDSWMCLAHPVQVYLDLKGHPERADEAAERFLQGIVRTTYGR